MRRSRSNQRPVLQSQDRSHETEFFPLQVALHERSSEEDHGLLLESGDLRGHRIPQYASASDLLDKKEAMWLMATWRARDRQVCYSISVRSEPGRRIG